MKENKKKENSFLKEFTGFLQEYGFIWGPSPEIYGGVAGFYTYGPYGKLLKNKIENNIRKVFQANELWELEGPTVLPNIVWEASGHLGNFKDRVITCSKCKKEFRVDKLIEEATGKSATHMSNKDMLETINKDKIFCPLCNGALNQDIEEQSLMMLTKVAGNDSGLRPETATVTYLPYKLYYNLFRKKLPIGVFQIGKAYRNEISPRQNVIRGREFTQAEGQIYIDPQEKNKWERFQEIKNEKLPFWDSKSQDADKKAQFIPVQDALDKKLIKTQAYAWCLWLAYTQFKELGIPVEKIRLRQHHPDEKAFYADDAWDVEINLNSFGWTEVCGVHDRTDYDLKQHSRFSGQELIAIRENGERFVPHVLEIAFGTDRPTYTLLDIFYEKKGKEEGKTVFRVPYSLAPIDIAVYPLMKKDELVKRAREIKKRLEKDFVVVYDESGSIGRRYLRSAIVGTPYCITADFEGITLRDRDTEKQIRISVADEKNIANILRQLLSGELKFEDAGKALKS